MTARGVSAIVLAGGRSSRFGRDKLAEPFDGLTLLEQAVAAVGGLVQETIVAVRPGEMPNVPGGTIVVHDATAHEGPLVGLLAGLRRATQPIVLVVGGDMPTMVQSVLERLVADLDDPGIDAVVLEEGGRGRPLPAAVRSGPAKEAAERLTASGERRLRALYDSIVTKRVPEARWRTLDPDGRTLRDVDTPADLP